MCSAWHKFTWQTHEPTSSSYLCLKPEWCGVGCGTACVCLPVGCFLPCFLHVIPAATRLYCWMSEPGRGTVPADCHKPASGRGPATAARERCTVWLRQCLPPSLSCQLQPLGLYLCKVNKNWSLNRFVSHGTTGERVIITGQSTCNFQNTVTCQLLLAQHIPAEWWTPYPIYSLPLGQWRSVLALLNSLTGSLHTRITSVWSSCVSGTAPATPEEPASHWRKQALERVALLRNIPVGRCVTGAGLSHAER